ncbi:hypothetical protein VNO77_00530 [Canavalia gladiata]|uniref:Uncharacterized protein n=1 Tax=Canavalia gladiata TaxID=3824 RepID=A0AAN9R4G3_CANGL
MSKPQYIEMVFSKTEICHVNALEILSEINSGNIKTYNLGGGNLSRGLIYPRRFSCGQRRTEMEEDLRLVVEAKYEKGLVTIHRYTTFDHPCKARAIPPQRKRMEDWRMREEKDVTNALFI